MTTIYADRQGDDILVLGKVGENGVTTIVFDASWFSDVGTGGTYVLNVMAPKGSTAYPRSVTVSGNKISWLVVSSDLTLQGTGKCELQYTVGTAVKKSITWHTVILPSVTPVSATAPSAYTTWYQECIEARDGKIATSLGTSIVLGTKYFLGEQTAVSFTLPTATVGKEFAVIFYSGDTAAVLTVTGSYLGILPTISTNQRVELHFLYDGTHWRVLGNTQTIS